MAHPGGAVRVVTSGDARLATAGTGDVLSGIIGALLARGLEPFDAAAAGAWIHGRAATLGRPDGFVAGDLPGLLPAALAELAETSETTNRGGFCRVPAAEPTPVAGPDGGGDER